MLLCVALLVWDCTSYDCFGSYFLVSLCHCDVRSRDTEAEYVGGGAGDAAVLTRVAELAAEARRSRIH